MHESSDWSASFYWNRQQPRAVCDESRGGYREGETSESLKPKNGFGMKQGRREEGGIKRQEVEKT